MQKQELVETLKTPLLFIIGIVIVGIVAYFAAPQLIAETALANQDLYEIWQDDQGRTFDTIADFKETHPELSADIDKAAQTGELIEKDGKVQYRLIVGDYDDT